MILKPIIFGIQTIVCHNQLHYSYRAVAIRYLNKSENILLYINQFKFIVCNFTCHDMILNYIFLKSSQKVVKTNH